MAKRANRAERAVGPGAQVIARISERLETYLGDPLVRDTDAHTSEAVLSSAVLEKLRAVLALKSRSYRDGVIIQLAYGLASDGPLNHAKRPEGARGVAGELGTLFAARHIEHRVDAYSIIAKNSDVLDRGNQPDFDDLLHWANEASKEQREAAFTLAIAETARTARPVLPMPGLDTAKLSFAMMVRIIDELVTGPSGGAHEQFSVAAALGAVIEEYEGTGPGRLRVETKRIHASDASSGTTGDVQLKRAERTEEAIEVTANDWAEKIAKAAQLVRSADLTRAHIVASVGTDLTARLSEIEATGIDLSVIDTRALLLTLSAIMRKPGRATFLRRLYEHLERNQPQIVLVNSYVNLLSRLGLVDDGT